MRGVVDNRGPSAAEAEMYLLGLSDTQLLLTLDCLFTRVVGIEDCLQWAEGSMRGEEGRKQFQNILLRGKNGMGGRDEAQ